jgi:hypothetical protein
MRWVYRRRGQSDEAARDDTIRQLVDTFATWFAYAQQSSQSVTRAIRPTIASRQRCPRATHRSVSKRMLSSLKSAATRTRSTHAIRPMESEASLLRRISGRRKPANVIQPERRAYSFDVSRDSVASEPDHSDGQVADREVHRLDQRSFTDSTVSTSALVQDLESVTPPLGTPTGDRVVLKHRYSGAPESPPPRHPAGFELTPRPFDRTMQLATEQTTLQLTAPYIKLDVDMDTSIVDYGAKRNIWIAIEATVKTHTVDLPVEG